MTNVRLLIGLLALCWGSLVCAASGKVTRSGFGTIEFQGEINAESTKAFSESLRAIEERHPRFIVIELNSGGGFVDPGFLMAKAIEKSEYPIYCVVDGEADSMAFYVLQACPHRFMTTRSRLMIHEAYMVMPAGPTDRWEMRGRVDELDHLNENMLVHYANRLTIKIDELRARISHQRWWLSADEAKAIGAIDEIVHTTAEVQVLAGSAEAPPAQPKKK